VGAVLGAIQQFAAWFNEQNDVISKNEIGNETRPTEGLQEGLELLWKTCAYEIFCLWTKTAMDDERGDLIEEK
jgi:hypothetical protein